MLKVGMYVRYKQIFNDRPISIGKIIKFDENIECYLLDNHKLISDKDVIIASENIIDVIEVGDYVNGHRVIDGSYGLGVMAITEDIEELNSCNIINSTSFLIPFKFYPLKNMPIKSIVTHEQMEQTEYKVVEKVDD